MKIDEIPFRFFSEPQGDCYTDKRLQETIDFIRPDDMKTGLTLDIGDRNYVGTMIGQHFDREIWNTEPSDFNSRLIAKHPIYRTILCFEVFEHVMNAALFLQNIAALMSDESALYLSTPLRNRWGFMLSEDHHFHELEREKVEIVINYAGLEVSDFRKFKCYPFWKGMIKGGGVFRTFLRVTSQETGLWRLTKAKGKQ